jgi:peroxiredoxin
MLMKTKLLLASIIAFAASPLFAADSPPVGSAAPDFSATDSTGQQRSLSQFKGKFVVLEWFNPDCPFVRKHYNSGNMQKLQADATSKGAIWLTIDSSADGMEGYLNAAQAEAKRAEWKAKQTAFLLDADGKVGQEYGAKNTPHMFVINPEGKIVYEGAIDSRATPNPADIPVSTNYVKVALDQAMAGKPVSTPSTRPYGCSVKYKQG